MVNFMCQLQVMMPIVWLNVGQDVTDEEAIMPEDCYRETFSLGFQPASLPGGFQTPGDYIPNVTLNI